MGFLKIQYTLLQNTRLRRLRAFEVTEANYTLLESPDQVNENFSVAKFLILLNSNILFVRLTCQPSEAMSQSQSAMIKIQMLLNLIIFLQSTPISINVN